MIKYLNKKTKKLDVWDLGLIKGCVVAATLFLITIWPALMTWVHSVNPWHFLIAFIILVAKPFYRFYLK